MEGKNPDSSHLSAEKLQKLYSACSKGGDMPPSTLSRKKVRLPLFIDTDDHIVVAEGPGDIIQQLIQVNAALRAHNYRLASEEAKSIDGEAPGDSRGEESGRCTSTRTAVEDVGEQSGTVRVREEPSPSHERLSPRSNLFSPPLLSCQGGYGVPSSTRDENVNVTTLDSSNDRALNFTFEERERLNRDARKRSLPFIASTLRYQGTRLYQMVEFILQFSLLFFVLSG